MHFGDRRPGADKEIGTGGAAIIISCATCMSFPYTISRKGLGTGTVALNTTKPTLSCHHHPAPPDPSPSPLKFSLAFFFCFAFLIRRFSISSCGSSLFGSSFISVDSSLSPPPLGKRGCLPLLDRRFRAGLSAFVVGEYATLISDATLA